MGLVVFVKLRPIPDDAAYVGSDRCSSCHPQAYSAWKDSLHAKMMRAAAGEGVVVADFDSDDAGLGFHRDEAVWAIGSKWEQQFMGQEAGRETLLPGSWWRPTGRWDFTGWDGWQVPVPIKRCHGCHTVGLDVESEEFVEASIGCESCHGPGEWHVTTFGLGRILFQPDAQACGQCHTRGKTPSGEFFFPVGYRPGATLDDYFEFASASPGQNSTTWWGNGRARKRHQEYNAWRGEGHAHSLQSLREGYDGRYGEVEDACLGCHAAEAVLSGSRKPGISEVSEGITCSVCHNVHGDLAELRMGCEACHVEGAFYHTPERNAGHVACPASAGVGCVGCHMPSTVQVAGEFLLHDHAAGVVRPSDTLEWGTPSSCGNGGCHRSVDPELMQRRFDAHYPSGRAP